MEAEAPKAAAPSNEFPPSLSPITRRKLIDTKERAHAALRFVKGQLPPEASALPPGAPLGAPSGPLLGGPWLCEQLLRPLTFGAQEPLAPFATSATPAAADSAAGAEAAAAAAAAAAFSCCYTPKGPFPAAAVEAERVVQQQQQHHQQQQQQQQEEEDARGCSMSAVAVSAAVVATRPLRGDSPHPADPFTVAAEVASVFIGAQQTPQQLAQALDQGDSCGPVAAAAAQTNGSPLQGQLQQQQQRQEQQQQQHQTTNSISGLWHVKGPPDFKAHPAEAPQETLAKDRGALLAAALFAALPGAARGVMRAEAHHICLSSAK
ncbi:hypothetical protein ACSSS7_004886 [Eimeria intestinalis]